MTDQPSRTSSGRGLMEGTAWTAPAAVVSVAAPALAVSAECTPQTAAQIQQSLAFNGNITTWTQTRNPADAPAAIYQATYNGLSNAAVLLADPVSTSTSTTTLQSPTACLGPGTYTFTFDSRLVHSTPRPLQMLVDVIDATAGTSIGNTVNVTTTSGAVTSRTDVVTASRPERTQVRFRFRWVFDANASLVGDDIGFSAPRVARIA